MNGTPVLPPPGHRRDTLFSSLRANVSLLVGLAVIPWMVELLDFVVPGSFDRYGIRPREIGGLYGIAAAPLLHDGFGHLASNTGPFLILGSILLVGGRKLFLTATVVILALSGGALWMLGPSGTNHIGASILVFGYLGFLLARGIMERSVFWGMVSLAVLAAYGGMLAGVLPGERGVSWQGHLFGFLSGIVTARILSDPGTERSGLPTG